MNNLQLLKENQDVVYSILDNSLSNNTLAHAYLFSGIKGSLQLEAATLLISSVLCEQSKWACGVCDTCLRVSRHQYPDYIILDGSQSIIKKDDIINLQHQFSMTSLEVSVYKTFLIKDAHNMTHNAANALLKFLEEPSQNVLGILISDEVESLLPTVISRCTNINFKRLSYLDNYNLAVASGLDNIDAYYYSKVVHNYLELDGLMDDEAYLLFKDCFTRFINVLYTNSDQALYLIHNVILKHKDKTVVKDSINIFVDMLIVFFKDIIKSSDFDDWYDNCLNIYREHTNYLKLLEVVLEVKNQLGHNVNIPLTMDHMIYRFKEVI